MASSAKVLVIGLDSADRNLLMKWSDSGDVPVLQSLREKGVWGLLTSPPAMGDDATWASFYTAVSPARHGRYFWKQIQPGSYTMLQFRDAYLKREPFWKTLSRAGCRVAIIDVPKSPLSTNLNGFHLSDWLVHGRDHDTCSWPSDIALDVLARFGDDRTDRWGTDECLCRMDSLLNGEYEIFLRRLLDSVDKKVTVAAEFLGPGGWDLFLVVFKESHCIGHQCWHLLDETHPLYNAELAERLNNPIKRVYQSLDTAIGHLLTLMGPETNVIVFSDLGMGPNYTGENLLDVVLLRLESTTTSLWRRLYFAGKRMEDEIRTRLFRQAKFSSRSRRHAFHLDHNEMSGAIRINLRGREPSGRIQPGKKLEEFYVCLIQDLLELVNPDTGKHIVDQVLRTDSIFPGEYRDCLPDLFVIWRRDNPITAVASLKIGELRAQSPRYRTGNHLTNGIYIGSGPAFSRGEQSGFVSIMDIGPTIATLLDTSMPDTDGKPIAALYQGSEFAR